MFYNLTMPPYALFNRLKLNYRRNLSARMFIFNMHNNYHNRNKFCKFSCD